MAEDMKGKSFLRRFIEITGLGCFFNEHYWRPVTKESNLAECLTCGCMPTCPKHGERFFVHGYHNRTDCLSCFREHHAAWMEKHAQKHSKHCDVWKGCGPCEVAIRDSKKVN